MCETDHVVDFNETETVSDSEINPIS